MVTLTVCPEQILFVLAFTANVVTGTVPKLTATVLVRNVSQVFSGNLKALIFKP